MWKLWLARLVIIASLSWVSFVVIFLLTKPDREMLDIILSIIIIAGQASLQPTYKKLWNGEQE